MNDITTGAAPTPADNLHAELRSLIATNLRRMVKFAEAIADTAIVSTLSAKNLRRMVQFAQVFAEPEIVATLSRQLSWSHFVNLLPLKNEPARQFYASQAASQTWSVRELRQQIERKAFERTELASLQAPTPVHAEPTEASPTSPAQVFKDPYFLDFLGLRQGHDEADPQPRTSGAAANAQRRHHRGRILDRATAQGGAGAASAPSLARSP